MHSGLYDITHIFPDYSKQKTFLILIDWYIGNTISKGGKEIFPARWCLLKNYQFWSDSEKKLETINLVRFAFWIMNHCVVKL